jgi:dienelactone hydrolase
VAESQAFVLDTADMRAVNVQRDIDYHGGDPGLRMEVYRPVGVGPWPLVLCVDGEEQDPAAVEGRARLAAASGMVGVVFAARSWDRLRHVERKVADVDAALRFVRARGRSWGAEPGRWAVWAAAGGVPLGVSLAMREGAACAVAYYGVMDLRPYGDDPRLSAASPMALVEAGEAVPPLLVVRCGQDAEELNESIDSFTNAAWDRELPVELLAYEEGHHGFEVVDDAAESRDVLQQTIEFLREHLGGG